MSNKLFLLTASEATAADGEPNPFAKMTTDFTTGFVISAPDEKQARFLASQNCGDEGTRAWASSKFSDAKCIAHETEEYTGVILRDTI